MPTDKEMLDIIKKRVLDKIPFSYGITFEDSWLKTVDVAQYVHDATERLTTCILFELPGVVERERIYRPLTWWDMFKERHFSAWAAKFFPIRYERIQVRDIYHLYPQKQFGHSVVVGRE